MARRNRWAAVLLGLAAILIFLIAASISGLDMEPGQPFALAATEEPAAIGGDWEGGEGFMAVVQIFLALALVFLPFYVLYSLLTPAGRKRLLVLGLVFGLLLWGASSVREPPPPEPETALEAGTPSESDGPIPNAPALAPAAPPSEPPDWITAALIVGFALLLSVLVFGLVWWFRQRQEPPGDLDRLGEEARRAILAIESGGDLGDSILTAYRDMARIVRATQGLERSQSTTPHEFLKVLVSKGLPPEAVSDLTVLFEAVRYGSKLASRQDEQRALASLRAIAAACERNPVGS